MFFTYLQSEETSRNYLAQCYQRLENVDAEKKSYENCRAFMYYLDRGMQMYEQGAKLSANMQPILYFYGMVHLVKGCLLTIRPDYPESTNLLAHGVTARKRKKKNYAFMKDEVKIQHKGLFPYMAAHLLSSKTIPFEKIKMEDLLACIPEMLPLFQYQDRKKIIIVGKKHSPLLEFPVSLLDSYHLTEKAFINKIKNFVPEIKYVDIDKEMIRIELVQSIEERNTPFFVHASTKHLYFPADRDLLLPISEIIVHYLLLYNLSMLSRYETEWWGDLFAAKSEIDYPFILQFLQCTQEKIPAMLEDKLEKKLTLNSFPFT
ncbi:YaaC family protein [Virgibacillus oceani]